MNAHNLEVASGSTFLHCFATLLNISNYSVKLFLWDTVAGSESVTQQRWVRHASSNILVLHSCTALHNTAQRCAALHNYVMGHIYCVPRTCADASSCMLTAALHCTALHYTTLHYTLHHTLHHSTPLCPALYCTAQHCTAQHGTAQHSTAQRSAA